MEFGMSSSKPKQISHSQYKKMMKKMQASYKKGEELKEKIEQTAQIDQKEADEFLEENLHHLS